MTDQIIDQWEDSTPTVEQPNHRHILLTPASAIPPRRVRWLWKDRVAYGTLALLAGREGLGKSTLAYALGADITRGSRHQHRLAARRTLAQQMKGRQPLHPPGALPMGPASRR